MLDGFPCGLPFPSPPEPGNRDYHSPFLDEEAKAPKESGGLLQATQLHYNNEDVDFPLSL